MLRLNFFYKIFKDKNHNKQGIIRYNSAEVFDSQNKVNIKILEIDKEISENSKALLEAQIVKFKSTFSKTNNFFDQIGKNVYKKQLDESIHWHQKQLKELYLKRKQLQISLEKLKGVFWLNRIKRFVIIILTGFFLLFSIFIFISGFMILIYLLPLIIFLCWGYWLINRKY
tara:strand:+ start:1273 stop:1785 length:513 start_codon:yes stop_codon:yes gene_type:complete